ncbi:MAG: hypothetical protein C0468_07190 [Planctomyces sp.]|nr:hypothetical protein [Planctomyces sp.]
MARSRQVIVMKAVSPEDDDDGLPVIGPASKVQRVLERYNTAPEALENARPNSVGLLRLFGPGMVLEMSATEPQVRQIMVTMTDEGFAFPVLARLCREQRWALMDPETGQRLRFGGA